MTDQPRIRIDDLPELATPAQVREVLQLRTIPLPAPTR